MKQTETEKEQRKQLFVEFQQSKVFNTDTKTLSCFSIEQRNNLVETNLKLVDYVLDRYFKPHKYNFDAKQEGRIGLLEAVERFEPAKGYQFSTYATPWIYSYIRAYLNGDSLKPKTPSHIEANISKLKKDGEMLRYVPQTPEICQAAVDSDPKAIKYVKDKSMINKI